MFTFTNQSCHNLINETTTQGNNEMFDNEMRKKLIKSLIRTYYQMELNAEHHEASFQTYERLEFEMKRLMTAQEYETFMNCNEFDNTYWSDI